MAPSPLTWLLLAALSTAPSLPRFVVPNFTDLTIKTRMTYGLGHPMETTLLLKGARQRTEHHAVVADRDLAPFGINIVQCDQKMFYHLNPRSKTYSEFPSLWRDAPISGRPVHKEKPSGPVVTVTIDSVDTGDRRQMSGYEARHVKTSISVTPGPGAETKSSTTEIDGWYLDLPGLNCRDTAVASTGFLTTYHPRERMQIKHRGTGQRGFVIEETSTKREDGQVVINKTELVEFSDAPLDESLFEVPADYTRVERSGAGAGMRDQRHSPYE